MVRRKHRLLSLLTALAMLFSLMSGFTVFAEEEPGEEVYYGLKIGSPSWDEDAEKQVFDAEFMGGNIFCDAGRHFEFTIGWKGSDGEIVPFTEEDMADVIITDSEGQPVYIGLSPSMYGYSDPETGRWEEAPAGDGIYNGCFGKPGVYTVTYEGERQAEVFPEGALVADTVTVEVYMPLVSLYADEVISEGSLIGDEVTYMPGTAYYILAEPLLDDGDYKTETEILNFEYDEWLKEFVTLEEIRTGEIYKLTIPEGMEENFSIRVIYEQDDYQKDESEEFQKIREAENDIWINFNAPLRLGLVADWTQWSDEDPDQPVVDFDSLRDTIDGYQIMDWNTFTFGWKGEDGKVTLISTEDVDKFTAYAEDGTEITEEWINQTIRHNEETDEDYVLGNGCYDIRFTDLGIHKIVYDSGESLESEDENVVWSDTVIFKAVMPEVSLYSSEMVSRETLIGSRAEYTDEERTFYVNILNDEGSDWKKEITLTGFELQGPSDAAENVNVTPTDDGGYKVVIKDGYNDNFGMKVSLRISQSRLEEGTWKDDGGWDRDYWIEFNRWEPEYYGLGVAWPWYKEEELPTFPDELFRSMGFEAKVDRTLCIGWTDAKGNMVPVALTDINKLHLYDPDGNEVTGDWIRYPKRWNEGEETDLGIEGMFEVTFPGTGTYVIKYEKDISGEEVPEGMAVTNECEFHVEYPDLGIYSANEKSDGALIGEHVVFENSNRVFYVITADHEDEDDIFTRTIKSYKVIMPYGFEDKASDVVTIDKINDHTLKVTVAENTELGFDLELEVFSTNKYYDHGRQTWVDSEETWTDRKMLNFWPKEIIHYGLVAGFVNPPDEGNLMGNMQQYLDGFFELYGNSLVFGWRNSAGEEVQIREDDLINHIKVLNEGGKPVAFELEKQDNDDYIYDIRFLEQGLFYIYYDGDKAVDENVEDTVYQNWIKVWVDPPIMAVYDDAKFSDKSLVGLSVEYQPDDKLVYYLGGVSVGDERGTLESYVTNVSVYGVNNPDFVNITMNDDGTAKVEITKFPNKDYDGQFILNVTYRIDCKWYDEMGELEAEEHEERTDRIDFAPGDGFATGKISVSYTTEGATPAAPKLYIYNRGLGMYFDLEGNVLSSDNRWVTVPAGTTFVIDNLLVGCYNIVEDEATLAVEGYDLDKALSIELIGGVMVEDGKTSLAELRSVYKSNKVIYPYRSEWKDGVWYNADGTQTYKPKASWKHNSKGYWYSDTSGWFAEKEWVKIDGKSYYFDASGYMAADEYIDGYYLTKNGPWDGKGKAQWKGNATKGWWYSLPGGTYLKNCWAKIDGKWYYFKSNGYAAKNEWVKGYYWIGSNCVWTYKPKGSWHKTAAGWWFGDSSGWYAKNETIVIDGVSYTFNAKGYTKK